MRHVRAVIANLQTWLEVVRDAFVSLLPLTFLGLIAVLLRFLPWDFYVYWANLFGANDTVSFSVSYFYSRLSLLIQATLGVLALALTMAIATRLTFRRELKDLDGNSIPAGFVATVALINFMIYVFAQGAAWSSLGRANMLVAVIIGIGSVEIMRWLLRSPRLAAMGLPYETSANFYFAMRLTPHVVTTVLMMLLLMEVASRLALVSAYGVVAQLVNWAQHQQQVPAIWLLGPITALVNQVGWFLGFHGMALLEACCTSMYAARGAPYSNELLPLPLLTQFVHLGGAGATLGMIGAIFWVGRNEGQRRVAQLSVVPACFNINETVIYGLPIALNPIYFLPFVVVPVLLSLMAIAAVESGWMILTVMDVPWTTPPIVSGFVMTGSWRGAAVQMAGILLSFLFYLPFVRKAQARVDTRNMRVFQGVLSTILEHGTSTASVLDRGDEVGLVARRLLLDLRKQVKESAQGLRLHYQPKHDKYGVVVGVEALLRWQHVRYGQISPLVAIALAADGADIAQLGAWVLDEACACKARWNAQGQRHLVMCVNVAPAQLTAPGMAASVLQVIHAYGLEPHEIELEITETAAIPSMTVVDQNLQELSAAGVHLSMDDFGMGYSSLLYLRRFSISTIKIDGSLTREVLTSHASADIIRVISELAHDLNASVVAEYVETEQQRRVLLELGCDFLQGYLYSEAVPESQCLLYLEAAKTADSSNPVMTSH